MVSGDPVTFPLASFPQDGEGAGSYLLSEVVLRLGQR